MMVSGPAKREAKTRIGPRLKTLRQSEGGQFGRGQRPTLVRSPILRPAQSSVD
jgi:hypothetical protein